MTPQEKARSLRPLIEKAAISLPDDDALEAVELFPPWSVDIAYEVDQRIRYGGKLYRVVQAHTSQKGWEPYAVPALWAEVARPGEIPVWRQPTGAQDSYMKDDLVYYPTANDPIYISLYDNNIWEPSKFGWEILTSSSHI